MKTRNKTMENVNHPTHYNQHPAGIECIDIIRHYTCDIANAIKYLWRAGLKAEMGKDDAEKEIEDLKKAIWYIEDYAEYNRCFSVSETTPEMIDRCFVEITEHTMSEATAGYCDQISQALFILLQTGIIINDIVVNVYGWSRMLDNCKRSIQDRILAIKQSLLDKELKETVDVMHGKAIDGEDYVSKPGCVRETEPGDYDPLNMVVAWGRVYSLTSEVRKKGNGALYSPCDVCALSEYCVSSDGTSSLKGICNIHGASDQQYYHEVGNAKYSPRFGTVEVCDPQKEMELELKNLYEDD